MVANRVAILSTVSVLLIMFMVCADVVLRTVTGGSFGGAVEYSEILLVVVVALGIAEGQRTGKHVSVDLLIQRLPVRIGAALRGAGYLLSLGLLVWMTVASTELAWTSVETGEMRFGLRHVVLWPARVAIAVGLALLVLEVVRSIINELRVLVTGSVSGPTSAPPERQMS